MEVTATGTCACGCLLPVLTVLGRKEEFVQVQGVPLHVDTVERLVYAIPGITGYMIEVNAGGTYGRLLGTGREGGPYD